MLRILHLAAGAGLLALTGCGSATGDFGEPRASFLRDDIHDWVGPEATGSVPSGFQLTDEERQLRDLAYPLIEPPYDRRRWYSVAGEYGISGFSRASWDRTAYANNLLSEPTRSPSARYARLIDDIRNDTQRLSQFFETAAFVSDMDRKRQRSIAYIASVTPGERADAARRVRENTAIIRTVQASLGRRAESYRFAMERLILMAPSPQAVEVERAINQLRAGLAIYRDGAPAGRSVAVQPLGNAQAQMPISK